VKEKKKRETRVALMNFLRKPRTRGEQNEYDTTWKLKQKDAQAKAKSRREQDTEEKEKKNNPPGTSSAKNEDMLPTLQEKTKRMLVPAQSIIPFTLHNHS
jgi:hypothetical protein